MFNHILVPLDGSGLAESALPAAASLAARLAVPVTLIHIIEKDAPEEIHKDRHLTRPDEAEEYLRSVAQKNFPPGVQVDWHVHTAEVKDVARSIAEHAEELSSELVVMCTHGRSGVRNMLFGSIAQQVIARGATPVLMLHPTDGSADQPFTLKKILLPLDSGSNHDGVFPYATRLAEPYGAGIDMLTVIPTFSTLSGEDALASSLLPGTTAALLDLEEQATREHLQAHLEELRQAGFAVTASIARGDPASEIVAAAEKRSASLLLLATHRRAGMDAFWARSVAPNIARHTRLPLLLLPLN